MRYCVLLSLAIWHPILLGAQERLVLNADLAREESPKQIVASTGYAIVHGTDHGQPPRPSPVTLTMISVALAPESANTDPLRQAKLLYEFRLTNTGMAPINIPVSPDLSKIFLACHLDGEHKVGLVLAVRSGEHGEETMPGTSDWSGCLAAKGSTFTLSHGEWITYRGSVPVASGVAQPSNVSGTWMLSDVRYGTTAGGLTQNTKTTVSAVSESRKVE
jgi:hypothetical protein